MSVETLERSSGEPAEPAFVKEPLISCDSHVHFTDEWVKERLSKRLQTVWDHAQKEDAEFSAKVRRQGERQLELEDFIDLEAAMDPGHFDPHAKLAAMDRDGVQAEVIFPEVGAVKLCTPKYMGDDWKDVLAGFNKSMADFAAVNPDRLLSAYQISPIDIPHAVREVERVASQGAKCVQLPSFPSEYGLPEVDDPRYDPLWQAIGDAGLTILNHLEIREEYWKAYPRDRTPQKGIFTAMGAASLKEPLMYWILTGTLEKFPKLKVVLVEPGLGWLPWFIDYLDKRCQLHYSFPNMKNLPSDYFKTQMGATFMDEPEGLAACYEKFGADCLFWSTDFPHPATCWPNSQRQVQSQFAAAGIPEVDRRKIVYENSIKAFGLKPASVG